MTSKLDWPDFTAAASDLEKIVLISRFYGSDPEFVLAGGGNTSVKSDERLWVKASGHALATITGEGFVEMDRALLRGVLQQDGGADVEKREAFYKQAILDARVDPSKGQRPSVECAIHNILPARFVVHTHATRVNMLTCCVAAERLAREWFGPDEAVWIPYVDPGLILAQTIARSLESYRSETGRECPPAILMANHGLIVCGETPEEVRDRTDRVLNIVNERLPATGMREPFGAVERLDEVRARQWTRTLGPAWRGLLAEEGAKVLPIVTFDDSESVLRLAGTAGGTGAAAKGPLTPDQIVYCGSYPLCVDLPVPEAKPHDTVRQLREALARYKAEHGILPKTILVRGLGLFAAGESFRAAETVRLVYVDALKVMAGAQVLGGISKLTDEQRTFIENWEAESYRKKISGAPAGTGRIAGKVAIVTGAAQGFGLEIARDLAAEGAHVVLTDLQAERVLREADALREEHGTGRAVAFPMDVTEKESIEEVLNDVVRAYGGVDLFVSNAGVLLADSVKTLPPKDFDFVTRVNYRGYFLCVQAVAPVMALQHLAHPEIWFDIVQMNSKSGLAGSNKNGAYAGGKFGGIGLTQSFALELVEDGIKVNSICPGNFFDGPLWSDPENGLFVQYLRTNKVPGAQTVADVRRAYEAKVPMRRGCTAADVMKAIYYVIDQKYETGQAVPVTGGQVMLH